MQALLDGAPAQLGGRRARTILAVLLCNHDQVVPTERLVSETWAENAPRTATETLHSYVSRLRRALEPDRPRGRDGRHLITHAGGYELRLDGARVDALEFVRLIDAGAALVDSGQPEPGIEALNAALDMWGGTPLHDVDAGPTVAFERRRLEEYRLRALEARIGAELARGRHTQVAGELEALVGQEPLREQLHVSRILALHRSGRQADALEAIQHAWQVFRDELGLEPSARLGELHAAVLNHDPALDWHPATGSGPSMAASADSPRGNLPSSLTTFVGRAEERGTVNQLLADRRLVTVTGLAGLGKTRLAHSVAAEQRPADGTWLVELADCADPADVLPAVADLLDVSPRHGESLKTTLVRALADRDLLLVLDSCEHVREACAAIVEPLLRCCERLRVLTTSRAPLGVHGEAVFALQPLPLPDPSEGKNAERNSAVRLFVDRARLVDTDFALDDRNRSQVISICRRLGGLPLAIELAAARLRVLSVSDLAQRVRDPLALLEADGTTRPARHRTLRAALDASCDLLDDGDTALLGRLSVFQGGFPLDAVQAVCTPPERNPKRDAIDALDTLIDRSLVTRRPAPVGPSRYQLLPPIRRYAAEGLDPSAAVEVGQRHASFFSLLAEQAGPELTGPGQVEWFNRLHHEQGNIRAALRFALRNEQTARLLHIAGSIWWFWFLFGHLAEGYRWLSAAQRAAGSGGPAALRGRVARGAGTLAWAQGAQKESIAHLRLALDFESRGDADGDGLALTLGRLARTLAASDRLEEAERLARKGLDRAQKQGSPWSEASLREALGETAQRRGDLREATKAFRQAEAGYHHVGDEWSACLARLGAARAARATGDHGQAAHLHRVNLARSLDLTASTFDFIGISPDLEGLADLAATVGKGDLAETLHGVAARLPRPEGPHASQGTGGMETLSLASTRVSRIPSGWAASQRTSLREDLRRAVEATKVLEPVGAGG